MTGIVAHVGAGAAVHNPVVVVVEGRRGRGDIIDKIGGGGCRVEQIQQLLVELRRQSRGARLGAWVTARWVPDDALATVMGVTRFSTFSATEVATGGAGVGCCESHGFRRQWTDDLGLELGKGIVEAKKELEDAFIVCLFLQIFEGGELTFEVIEAGIIPVAETGLKVNPNLLWIGVVGSGVGREPSTKLSLFLALRARVMAFCHFGKLSPVRRPETRTRLGESEGWRVYGEETVEVGGEDEEAMEVWVRDRNLHPLKLLFLIFTEIPWPRIRARARAPFATTHHRHHHQQWWRILALSPLAVFLSHGLHGLTLSLDYLSLFFLTEALRHTWPEQELELPHGLILTLTEVLDLAKAPSPELELPHRLILILTLTEVLDLTKAPSLELELPHGLILTLTEVLDLAKAPSPELELPHGLILTLTEVLDLAKAPSPELELPHGLILTLTEVLDLAKAPSPELELPHGLILTLTEVLDLSKAPSPKLDSHHGHGQELSSSHPLILMAPNLTGLMMAPL
uniref:Uncharacterized protein n=1 Tax=Fagus sylvatica TaxID=28930 RepID=A0A2N9FCZ6_FAGSY